MGLKLDLEFGINAPLYSRYIIAAYRQNLYLVIAAKALIPMLPICFLPQLWYFLFYALPFIALWCRGEADQLSQLRDKPSDQIIISALALAPRLSSAGMTKEAWQLEKFCDALRLSGRNMVVAEFNLLAEAIEEYSTRRDQLLLQQLTKRVQERDSEREAEPELTVVEKPVFGLIG